jgi:xylulokinase
VDGKVVPLTKALTWMDVRAGEEFNELKKVIAVDDVYRINGWRMGKGSAMARLRWLKKYMPEEFSKTKIILSTADYIYYRLTGKLVIDYSSAAMMSMFDVANGCWNEKLVELGGITVDMLPKLVDTGHYLGEILPEVAKDLTLPSGVKVYAGAHDQYAASLGSDYFGGKDLVISTGTTWVLFGKSKTPVFNERYLAPGRHPNGGYGVIVSAVSSGTVMEWTKNLFGEDFKALDEKADAKAVEKDLLVYPFVSGCGGYRGGNMRYSVKGATMRHDKYDIYRATMEGVAFEIKKIVSLYRESGIVEDKIIVSGGASRSKIWMKILASVLGKEVYISNHSDRTCFGAFAIAKKGYEGGDYFTFKFEGFTVEPDTELQSAYEEKNQNYEKQF